LVDFIFCKLRLSWLLSACRQRRFTSSFSDFKGFEIDAYNSNNKNPNWNLISFFSHTIKVSIEKVCFLSHPVKWNKTALTTIYFQFWFFSPIIHRIQALKRKKVKAQKKIKINWNLLIRNNRLPPIFFPCSTIYIFCQ